MESNFYAYCFSHGLVHYFMGKPWCTADWVGFVASSYAECMEAKIEAYGEGRFLSDISLANQIEVLEIRGLWNE